ncbi:MAG: serine hydrolase [Solibacillus sp.]|uniref:serine hydrolase n=1 Tax=unclassified Solibacillus TaxID=2637870 RepID=UPI0030F8EDC7
MTIWAWIGLLSIVFFSFIPLLEKGKRTTYEISKAIFSTGVVIGIIIAVLLFQVPFIVALFFGFLAMILFDKKTYTKKRLLIYSALIVILVAVSYALFRDNPNYVVKHLKENPETSSLYVAKNGETIITYQSDVIRPLASTVKILIAVEYAMQIDAKQLSKDTPISIDLLNRFYYENTDGGAHQYWLSAMKEDGKLKNNTVALHEVVKGMITYSSNANTDFLIDWIGQEAINHRAVVLGLTQHEEIYPIVGSLYIPVQLQQSTKGKKELLQSLKEMPIEEYRALAATYSQQMKTDKIQLDKKAFDLSLDVQKIWSDRLIGASANDYGKLLAIISNEELPSMASETLRDIMEWPMQLFEENHQQFVHLGAKGGSTAFVLNNALYAENHNGDKVEFVLLMDDLNLFKSMLLSYHLNSFESNILRSEEFLYKVLEELK